MAHMWHFYTPLCVETSLDDAISSPPKVLACVFFCVHLFVFIYFDKREMQKLSITLGSKFIMFLIIIYFNHHNSKPISLLIHFVQTIA